MMNVRGYGIMWTLWESGSEIETSVVAFQNTVGGP
jgi:hypothetical protein